MDSKAGCIEERLKSFVTQLQAESAIFERMVHKNKNQHRRCSYFQYILKVRRDLMLLQSTKLDELLTSCFHVISGSKPSQKIYLLESLKRRKCVGRKCNFIERLRGAARLLSQMVDPILKAATEISILLARSFFMGFALTMLALLARLRALVQQILFDVVSVFNNVSSLSQQQHSVKMKHQGIEVYREFYPTDVEFITLECVWESDKFILVERMNKNENGSQGGDVVSTVSKASVNYETIESFLGDDEPERSDQEKANEPSKECFNHVTGGKAHAIVSSSEHSYSGEHIADYKHVGNVSSIVESVREITPSAKALLSSSYSSPCLSHSNKKSGAKNVAFISVKAPTLSATETTDTQPEKTENRSGNNADSFFSLLTSGSLKDSLF